MFTDGIEFILPDIGVCMQISVFVIHEAFGDGDDGDIIREDGEDIIGEPNHAERADAANYEIGIYEGFVDRFYLIGF